MKDKYEIALGRARAAYGTGAYDDATIEYLFPHLAKEEKQSLFSRMKALDVSETLSVEDSFSRRNTVQNYAATLKRYYGARYTVNRDGDKLIVTRTM